MTLRALHALPRANRRDDVGPAIGTLGYADPSNAYATILSFPKAGYVPVVRVPVAKAPANAYIKLVEHTLSNPSRLAYTLFVARKACDRLWPANAPHTYSTWTMVPPAERL